MTISKPTHLITLVLLLVSTWCQAREKNITCGAWRLSYDERAVTLSYNNKPLLSGVTASFTLGQRAISTADYERQRLKVSTVNDVFGKGKGVTIVCSDRRWPQLILEFHIYPTHVTTRLTVRSDKQLAVAGMKPIIATAGELLSSAANRRLFVPYDNDAWIRFSSVPMAKDTLTTSYEVMAVYQPASRQGVVIGAVNHDQWKNALSTSDRGRHLEALSGVADKLTRDRRPHGVVRGEQVSSAMFTIGVYSDWRDGMDQYAQFNCKITPSRKWDRAMPVGWNSWGALAFNVNHDNSVETSDFFARHLQNHSFCTADGLTYIGLDSGWNAFTEQQLKDFADHCKANHQVPCIYWTPFVDWGKDGNRSVPGAEQYKYRDLWLLANGLPQELDGGYAIDPTHPAVETMMRQTADLFRRCGYEYVKMDFMTHGRLEADAWHDKNVTTGTEAYNYGMSLLDSIFHDMYLNLSISPIFPAQYAQSRRIACDAWNKIKDTEYTMNALSYGWWVGQVYDYNDADHVVLRDATEGENRARITSSLITGIFILGDDYSAHGDSVAKARALKLLTHPEINRIATGRAFRPLRGDSEQSESVFCRTEANGDVYVAAFNYHDKPLSFTLPLGELGIDADDIAAIKELWTATSLDKSDPEMVIPAKDVRLLHILRK